MPADRLAPRSPGDGSLALRAEDVRVAREEVHRLRRGPIAHHRLLAARQSLLSAMESYAAELTARGLPIPRKLHDDQHAKGPNQDTAAAHPDPGRLAADRLRALSHEGSGRRARAPAS